MKVKEKKRQWINYIDNTCHQFAPDTPGPDIGIYIDASLKHHGH